MDRGEENRKDTPREAPQEQSGGRGKRERVRDGGRMKRGGERWRDGQERDSGEKGRR